MKEIERLRSKMIKIKNGKYFSDQEVVAASQELDAVLDKYQVMLRYNKTKSVINYFSSYLLEVKY